MTTCVKWSSVLSNFFDVTRNHHHHGLICFMNEDSWRRKSSPDGLWNLSEVDKSFHSGCTSWSVQCWYQKGPSFSAFSFCLPFKGSGGLVDCVASSCDWLLVLPTDGNRRYKWQGTFSKCLCIFSEVPLCHDGQWTILHIIRSLVSDGLPSWTTEYTVCLLVLARRIYEV